MKTDDMLGIGVIGLGFMGRTHISSYAKIPACALVAVADREVSRHSGLSVSAGNITTGSNERLFDPSQVDTFVNGIDLIQHADVDVVSITTPTPTHIELAHCAIDHGRHVLIEKPVSLRREEIIKLDTHAKKSGVLVMPAHCMRFWPAWVWMKRAVSHSEYGDVLSASFTRTGAAPSWNQEFYLDDESSGGALVDLHIHDVDFILHLFGKPHSVSSSGSRQHVTTDYAFGSSGPRVRAEGGWLTDPNADFTMRCSIECSRATIDFELSRDPEIIVRSLDGSCVHHPEASQGGTGYDGEIEAMVSAVKSKSTIAPVTLSDAADGMSVIDAELRSLRLQERISL